MISDRRSLTGMKVLIRKDKKQQHRRKGKQRGEMNSLQKELLVLGSSGRVHH